MFDEVVLFFPQKVTNTENLNISTISWHSHLWVCLTVSQHYKKHSLFLTGESSDFLILSFISTQTNTLYWLQIQPLRKNILIFLVLSRSLNRISSALFGPEWTLAYFRFKKSWPGPELHYVNLLGLYLKKNMYLWLLIFSFTINKLKQFYVPISCNLQWLVNTEESLFYPLFFTIFYPLFVNPRTGHVQFLKKKKKKHCMFWH